MSIGGQQVSISYTKSMLAWRRVAEDRKKREKREESGLGERPDGDDDPFPRRSSPTSNWSSDPRSQRRKEVVSKITLQCVPPCISRNFLLRATSSFDDCNRSNVSYMIEMKILELIFGIVKVSHFIFPSRGSLVSYLSLSLPLLINYCL